MESPNPGMKRHYVLFLRSSVFHITFSALLFMWSSCRSVCLVELDQSLQGLLSFERLDRASPDLWPEQSELQFMDLIRSADANKPF